MKILARIAFIGLLTAACSEKPVTTVTDLKCEYKTNPLGIDIEKPRLSWTMESNLRGAFQTAYQVLVATDSLMLTSDSADVWNSNKINSENSVQVEYEGKTLESNTKYFWKVKVWDQTGKVITSAVNYWTTGFLNANDWKAKWIGLDKAMGEDDPHATKTVLSARMLRHEFHLPKKVKQATAFISGLGLFEFYVNGNKAGDQVLAPALSEYDKRAYYMTFDITSLLLPDKNAVGVILGNGRFFSPRSNTSENTRTYGFPKVICQIEVKFDDGTSTTIISDESWKLTTNGPIRKNNEYDGEYYDARMEMPHWSDPGFDDTAWMQAEPAQKPGDKLTAQPNEPIRIMDELTPVSVNELQKGTFIFDLGQNMVGWVQLFVRGNKGEKVTLRFAETLNKDGSLFLDNIRTAEVTDTYILKGDGEEQWEPRFTYHGFRYVEIKGYPGTPKLSSIKGKVIHDALHNAGKFSCSDTLVNSIYKNAYWGIRGNYRSIPTDCPQRDERQGWLGDRSAECTGESYVFNIPNLYNKWVTDIADAQRPSGSIPDVAPSYWPFYNDNMTWPGTFLFASDMLFTQYADKRVLESQYPAMKKWIEYMKQYVRDGIMTRDTYGDWCVPPEDQKLIHSLDARRITSSAYIGTAYFYHELGLMKRFAGLLGKNDDAEAFGKEAEAMKKAFNDKFLDKNLVVYSNNTATANILALYFDLVPEEFKERITDNLLQKIMGESSTHISNGIVGGQWLMRTLTKTGHADVAYALAKQRTYPGWGYMVEHGATTIWELWNGDYGDPGMNSGNHVMQLGDLIIWFYENLAGIKADPKIPGFKHIIMKPSVSNGLSFADASFNSPYGLIKSNWNLKKDEFTWNITIPANTTATVYVPTLNREDVKEGRQSAAESDGVKFIRWEENTAVYEIVSGSYIFKTKGIKENVTPPYLSLPVITPRDTMFFRGQTAKVSLTNSNPKAVIRYTTDDTEVNGNSPVYSQPFEISSNTVINARAYLEGYQSSNNVKAIYDFADKDRNGVQWAQYNGAFRKIPDMTRLKAAREGSAFRFSLEGIDLPKYNFALRMKSFISIENDGMYTFYLISNDGSKLYIDNKLLIDSDGEHGIKESNSSVYLKKGKHPVKVEYFQSGGTKALSVLYSSAEIKYQAVPASALFKSKD